MSLFTKPANEIFAPTDGGGAQRSVLNGDVQLWGTEVETLLRTDRSGAVNVLQYGAVGDYIGLTDTGTDNTAAFNEAIDALPDGGALFIPAGHYLLSASMAKILKSITVVGESSTSTVLVFRDCNGFDIELQNSLDASVSFRHLTLLAKSNAQHTAVKVTKASRADHTPAPVFHDVMLAGADLWYGLEGVLLNEWLCGVDCATLDRVTFRDVTNAGSVRQAIVLDFENDTVGYKLNALTHAVFENCSAFYYKTGLLLTGQSEGLHVNKSVFVLNGTGLKSDTIAPSSAFAISENHFSSVDCNIDIDGVGGNIGHTIAFNMMLRSGTWRRPSFDFVRIKSDIARIYGNTFTMPAGEASDVDTRGIHILDGGTREFIHGNHFTRIRSPLKMEVSGSGTVFAHNYIQDSPQTQSHPLIDDGQDGRSVTEYGNRALSRATQSWVLSGNFGARYRANVFDFRNFADDTTLLGITPSSASLSIPMLVTGGSVSAPGLAFNGDPDTGIWRPGANTLNFSTGGTQRGSFQEGLRIGGAGMSDQGVGTVNVATSYHVNDIKVVGAQGAAVSDAAGGSTVDAEARTAINAILSRLRAHGLIAT